MNARSSPCLDASSFWKSSNSEQSQRRNSKPMSRSRFTACSSATQYRQKTSAAPGGLMSRLLIVHSTYHHLENVHPIFRGTIIHLQVCYQGQTSPCPVCINVDLWRDFVKTLSYFSSNLYSCCPTFIDDHAPRHKASSPTPP